jgi:hypothetical protein
MEIKQAINIAESGYKCLDSTSFLVEDSASRILTLIEKESLTKYEEYLLAVEIFKLKALRKLFIIECELNKMK